MKRYINSNFRNHNESQISIDFLHDGNYDELAISNAVEAVLKSYQLRYIGIDFRPVDYSTYPEYANSIVSQCTIDFSWYKYNDAKLIADIEAAFISLSYEPIGSDIFTRLKSSFFKNSIIYYWRYYHDYILL